MNVHSTSRTSPPSINWRKFFWLAWVLLAVGYIYGQPTLERWFGIDLPDLGGDPAAVHQPEEEGESVSSSTATAQRPGRGNESDRGDEPAWSNADDSGGAFTLDSIGRDRFQSPAGLVYEMGPGGEHRIDHILRHARDDPSRPIHSVFDGDRDEILEILDEAYELIRQGGSRVNVESDRERHRRKAYTVDMRRRIGYEGGRSGKRKGYPELRRLKLVLDNDVEVVTAYPCR